MHIDFACKIYQECWECYVLICDCDFPCFQLHLCLATFHLKWNDLYMCFFTNRSYSWRGLPPSTFIDRFWEKKKNGCCIELYSRGFMLTSLIYVKIYKVSVALIQFCCIFCRANDICKESKRQTISAEDVFKALEEIEFPEFVASLRTSLEGWILKRSICMLLMFTISLL